MHLAWCRRWSPGARENRRSQQSPCAGPGPAPPAPCESQSSCGWPAGIRPRSACCHPAGAAAMIRKLALPQSRQSALRMRRASLGPMGRSAAVRTGRTSALLHMDRPPVSCEKKDMAKTSRLQHSCQLSGSSLAFHVSLSWLQKMLRSTRTVRCLLGQEMRSGERELAQDHTSDPQQA